MSQHRGVARSLALYDRARGLIPGGTHLFGRRAELGAWGAMPIFAERHAGGRFWDVDGHEYVDLLMGAGAIILGHAYPPVVEAVQRQAALGTGLTINHPLEVELAELLTEVIPCAERVRFCKGGGEADAIAIRIARAATGRDKVAFCGYHGWHDWYIAANLADDTTLNAHLMPGIEPRGVPKGLTGTAIPFAYNNLDSLRAVLDANDGQIAAIIMEACRSFVPEPGFLEGVRELASARGIVLIFDEVVTGFRVALGGAQELYGVTPDLATYAKTLSNGFALGAVVGRREVMECAADSFISSVYWAEATGLAAGLASVRAMREVDAAGQVRRRGEAFMAALRQIIADSTVPAECFGLPPFPFVLFRHATPETNLELSTLYMQEMAQRGIFAIGVNYFCVDHTDADLDQVLTAARETFGVLAQALDSGDVKSFLECPVKQSGFRRLV
ncbi:MAG: aminotransferase class III-fold pyridoxal phosphate-dependent enzyme [Armatimonadetes bacterium]|nr:aminotransferase class III-fold pyridoxal phosphate-dependent enzyme [Armatimonadota bacterium]